MNGALSLRQNVYKPFLADICDASFIDALSPPFDIITSNPPYISRKEYDKLAPSVKDFEDSRALLGNPLDTSSQDGLSFYHSIARLVSTKGMLSPDALIALEVGEGQAEAVEQILRQGGMSKTDIWLDPWKKRRVVIARV
jgi:methylase of polypeptide subunit release factors